MSAHVTVVETEESFSTSHIASFAKQRSTPGVIKLLRTQEKPHRLVLNGSWEPEAIAKILEEMQFTATTFPDFAAANREFQFVEEEPKNPWE